MIALRAEYLLLSQRDCMPPSLSADRQTGLIVFRRTTVPNCARQVAPATKMLAFATCRSAIMMTTYLITYLLRVERSKIHITVSCPPSARLGLIHTDHTLIIYGRCQNCICVLSVRNMHARAYMEKGYHDRGASSSHLQA